jgi:hypothetical protein
MSEHLQRFGVCVVWMVEAWHMLDHTHFHGEMVVVVWVVQHADVLVVRIQVFGVFFTL